MVNIEELYIVNDVERPREQQIAEKREDGRFYYIHPDLRDVEMYWGMESSDPESLAYFGIEVTIEGEQDDRVFLVGRKVRESCVTYRDGKRIRPWQGSEQFRFRLAPRPEVDVMSVMMFINDLADSDSNEREIAALQQALEAAAELLDENQLFDLEKQLPRIFREAV